MHDTEQELYLAKTRSINMAKATRTAKTLTHAALTPAAAAAEAARGPLVLKRPEVAPPPQRSGAVPPRALPPSVTRGAANRVAPLPETASHAFQWTPYHVRMNEPSVCSTSHTTLAAHGKGTYVNTLTLELRKETYKGATPHVLRLDPEYFVPKYGKPWVYLLNGSTPMVVVKGVVVCTAAAAHEGRNGPLVVARLPENMRPPRDLRFAVLARDQVPGATTQSKLVILVAMPDGNVVIEGGRSGQDEVSRGMLLDLSAIRFCRGNGIALIDDVHLYMCDIGGTRVICIQGTMSERFFNVNGRKPLALLPQSCRIRQETFFISPGTSGGFHLLQVRPLTDKGVNGSGEVVWKDSKWHRDQICVNGLMWEATEEAALLDNPMAATQATESQVICIMDFQRYLIRRFGSIQSAWDDAFDTDGSGSLNFTEFGLGCKATGFVGNATKLWAALDIDRSGEISLEELGANTEEMLAEARDNTRRRLEEVKVLEAKEMKELEDLSTACPSPNDMHSRLWSRDSQRRPRALSARRSIASAGGRRTPGTAALGSTGGSANATLGMPRLPSEPPHSARPHTSA